jgi:beta-glucanase (GH16 family)
VWNDEFDGPDGSAIDSTKWGQETGGSGWNNNRERQWYSAGTENAVVRGGSLVITARTDGADKYQCGYGTCLYTSARFNTKGKFEQKYGRFEARIQVPTGQGMWPAWWMLGNDISNVSWPQCGEIDIMENLGSEPTTIHGSMHGPGYSGGNPLTATTESPTPVADAFHRYTVEWEQDVVRFYFDDSLYETRTPADVPAGKQWVYDHPFFLILNLAVGGQWPGDPDPSTAFPQDMKVDYVRVFSR